VELLHIYIVLLQLVEIFVINFLSSFGVPKLLNYLWEIICPIKTNINENMCFLKRMSPRLISSLLQVERDIIQIHNNVMWDEQYFIE
jgi:hypothetical protein